MAQTQLSNDIFDRPYLLLTPGPLSTTPTVRQAMGRDWCTWDADYNEGVVSDVRRRVELLASPSRPDAVTSTLIQGSGTAAVEPPPLPQAQRQAPEEAGRAYRGDTRHPFHGL